MKKKQEGISGEEAVKRSNHINPDQFFPPAKNPLYTTASVLAGLPAPPPIGRSQTTDNSPFLQQPFPNPLQYYQTNSTCRFNPYFSTPPAPLVPLTAHNSLTSLDNIGASHQNTNTTSHLTSCLAQNNPLLTSLLPSQQHNPIPAHHNPSPLPAHIGAPTHHAHHSALPAHLIQSHHNIPAAHLNNTPAHLNNVIGSRNAGLQSHFNNLPAHLNSNHTNNYPNPTYHLQHNTTNLPEQINDQVVDNSINSPHSNTGVTGLSSPQEHGIELTSSHEIQVSSNSLQSHPLSTNIITSNNSIQHSTSENLTNINFNSENTREESSPQFENLKAPPKHKVSVLERARANLPPRKPFNPEEFKERQKLLSNKLNNLVRHKILNLVNSKCKNRETVDSSEVAKALSPRSWKDLMPLVKTVGTELIKEGLIVATRGGIVVDLATITGPVRFGLPEQLTDEEEFLIRTYTTKIKNQPPVCKENFVKKKGTTQKRGRGRGRGRPKGSCKRKTTKTDDDIKSHQNQQDSQLQDNNTTVQIHSQYQEDCRDNYLESDALETFNPDSSPCRDSDQENQANPAEHIVKPEQFNSSMNASLAEDFDPNIKGKSDNFKELSALCVNNYQNRINLDSENNSVICKSDKLIENNIKEATECGSNSEYFNPMSSYLKVDNQDTPVNSIVLEADQQLL